MKPATIHVLDLTEDPAPDAVAAQIRKLVRTGRGDILLIKGGLDRPLSASSMGWMGQLVDAEFLPVVVGGGEVRSQGLALLLLSDRAWLASDSKATIGGGLLPELAFLRLGPGLARRFAFAAEPVAELARCGLVELCAEPMPAARAALQALPAGAALRWRKGWRAARELPGGEALAYGSWYDRVEDSYSVE